MAFATVNKNTESTGEETFALYQKMCVANRIGEEFSTVPWRALVIQWLKTTLGLRFCLWKNDGQRGNASRRFPHIADFQIPSLSPSTYLAILQSTVPHLRLRMLTVHKPIAGCFWLIGLNHHLAGYMLSDGHLQCFTALWSFWKASLLVSVSKKRRKSGRKGR